MAIRSLRMEDMERLPALQPPDWGDIRIVFLMHFGKPYFKPFIIETNGAIMAVGQYILLKDTAWVGNIIVHQAHRSKGIGQLLTNYILRQLSELHLKSIYLLATPLGKPLYEKLNFNNIGQYQFFRHPVRNELPEAHPNIQPSKIEDHDQIYQLDLLAMGEDRSSVIKHFLASAMVYKTSKVIGFYLPALDNGLIIADDFIAGQALFEHRLEDGKTFTCIPEANQTFCRQLLSNKAVMYRVATLMVKGENKIWNPQMVYSRIAGNLG